MITNPWEEIGEIDPPIMQPDKVIGDIFKEISPFTGGKVKHKLQRVNYFPEEVRVNMENAFSLMSSTIELSKTRITVEPHPEFGYDTDKARNKSQFRYRSIFVVEKGEGDIEYEIIKFKYPLMFYPVKIYCDKNDYDRISSDFEKDAKFISINNESDLRETVAKIITSRNFKLLVNRLKSLA
jgi:hypothetical protein